MANEPIDPFDFFGLFEPPGGHQTRSADTASTGITIQQVLNTMDQVNENRPIWLARPKGRLHVAVKGHLPAGISVLVIQPPEDTQGLFGLHDALPRPEPTVVVSPVLYLRLKAAAREQGQPITDQEIASWFYYRAESERIQKRGTIPWLNTSVS